MHAALREHFATSPDGPTRCGFFLWVTLANGVHGD